MDVQKAQKDISYPRREATVKCMRNKAPRTLGLVLLYCCVSKHNDHVAGNGMCVGVFGFWGLCLCL